MNGQDYRGIPKCPPMPASDWAKRCVPGEMRDKFEQLGDRLLTEDEAIEISRQYMVGD